MLNKLENIKTNTKNVSVYDYDEYELQELLSRYYEEINKCIDVGNKSLTFLEWLKKEGLEIEVSKEMKIMIENGYFETVINTDIFGKLNTDLLKKCELYISEVLPTLENRLQNTIYCKITNV